MEPRIILDFNDLNDDANEDKDYESVNETTSIESI